MFFRRKTQGIAPCGPWCAAASRTGRLRSSTDRACRRRPAYASKRERECFRRPASLHTAGGLILHISGIALHGRFHVPDESTRCSDSDPSVPAHDETVHPNGARMRPRRHSTVMFSGTIPALGETRNQTGSDCARLDRGCRIQFRIPETLFGKSAQEWI